MDFNTRKSIRDSTRNKLVTRIAIHNEILCREPNMSFLQKFNEGMDYLYDNVINEETKDIPELYCVALYQLG